MSRTLHSIAAAALILAAGRAGAASLPSIDVERLWLDPSAEGSLVIGNGEVLPAGRFRSSLTLHYEHSPLALTEDGELRGRGLFSDEDRAATLVEHRTTLHVAFAIALLDRLELDLHIPIVADQRGAGRSDTGLRSPAKNGIGPPRLGLRQAVLGAPFTAALALDVEPEWSENLDYGGDEGWSIAPAVEVGRRFDGWLLAGSLGGRFRTKEVELPGGEELTHEVLAGVALATAAGRLRWEASARGAFNFDALSQSLELLGGLRWTIGEAELYALAGPGFLESPGTPTFRALLGIGFLGGAGKLERSKPAP
jgi:hypothetical protein